MFFGKKRGDSRLLAIVNGQVWTMAGQVYPRANVLLDGAQIKAVGPQLKVPAGVELIDAAGKFVLPGFIDAHCHLGIIEEIYQVEGDDGNETTGPVTPHLRALDAINPRDIGFEDALSGGVTTVAVTPGSANVIGGQVAIIKTAGELIDEMVIRAPAGLKAALGENPKRVYGAESKKMPATRMASAALLRETLVRGQNYIKHRQRAGDQAGPEADYDLKMEPVAKVLRREIPLRVHAHRADDIMTALRVAREFNLSIILEHCTEGHRVAEYIAAAGVPVVVGPVHINRAKVELMDRRLETAAVLARAGVPIAIMTDHPVVPIQYLSLSAGLACRGGLPAEKALEAITAGAARVLGVDKFLGSLEPGKNADIVIMNGHPFDSRSRVDQVLVNGQRMIG